MVTPPIVASGGMWVAKTCTLADWKAGGTAVAGLAVAAFSPDFAGVPAELAEAEAIAPSTRPAAAAPIATPKVLPCIPRICPPVR
jgi:hypothetical protein